MGARRWKRAKPWWSRWSGGGNGDGGLVLVWVVLVSRYRGGHKGSRRILILVSPNLLTYLTYPRSSSGTLGQLNPEFSSSSSHSRRSFPPSLPPSFSSSAMRQPPALLFASLSSSSFSFFRLSARSPFSFLPLLPVFSGAALR